MLSGETAMGAHPVEAVKTMALIARTTEQDINYIERVEKFAQKHVSGYITSAISHATVTTAHDLNAAAIITVTKSGNTARQISKYRPHCLIICLLYTSFPPAYTATSAPAKVFSFPSQNGLL